MGVSSGFALHARDRDGPRRPHDRVEAPAVERRRGGRLAAGLTGLLLALANHVNADTLRVGFLNAELQRDGPGLLLRDILEGEDEDIAATIALIAERHPDVLVLSGIDYDHGLATLTALRDRIAETGTPYAFLAAPRPNSGLDTGHDLDGDGRRRGPRDAQGYGEFAGQGGLAILSRHGIREVRDFSDVLWRDLPGTLLTPEEPGWDDQRLSSVAHVAVTIDMPGGVPVTVLAFHATPPVFDGPEDRNGRRNHDEAAFWLHYLAGHYGPPPSDRFILLGDANLDPADGDGLPAALTSLLAHPLLQDPRPTSLEARDAADREGGANRLHRGDPALDTANWRDGPNDPGNLRVDYVLPSRDWHVTDAGVAWSSGGERPTLRHGLVWVDLEPQRSARR